MNEQIELPCTDETVKSKTGRSWAEWRDLLDEGGGADLEHKQLAQLIGTLHAAGDWWSQSVAVGYERMKGKRSLHQRSNSSYSVSASKTLPINSADAHAYFVDEQKRALWLEEEIAIRTATAPKSVRFTWPDQTSVAVWISAKGENKCTVAVEHSKLESESVVAPQKQSWKDALQRLAKVAV